MKTNKKIEKRLRLKKKIRSKINGSADCPRLSVFRSNKHIYAQVINDASGVTLVSSSDAKIKAGTKEKKAVKIGEEVAKAAIAKKTIESCF